MTKHEQILWEAIAAALDGNPSATERKMFDNWYNTNNENKKFYETLLKSFETDPYFSKEVKERVYSKIEQYITNHERKTIQNHFWIHTAVATVALLIGVTITIFYYKNSDLPKNTFLETTVSFGSKSKLMLPDGSIVYLNSGTNLKYPSIFNGAERIVSLSGEAYFEVKKDKNHPFIVQTKDINIKVFGTHFNVISYEDEELSETTLVEGSVGVYKRNTEAEKDIIRLKPNQRAVYNSKTKDLHVGKIEALFSVSWTEGKFYFQKENMDHIVRKLERGFNMPIMIVDEDLKKKKFSGLFDKNKTLFQILDIMKTHKGFDYKIKNDTIMIFNK